MTAEGKMFGTISRVIIVCTRNSTVFITILYLTFVSECFPSILLRMDLRLRWRTFSYLSTKASGDTHMALFSSYSGLLCNKNPVLHP